jgi:hypothetical protein
LIEPQATAVDPDLMGDWLKLLARLEGNVEKDVVTDFASYGLAPPAHQFLVKSTITNAAGVVTNRLVAQLDIGARQADKIFARRPDESFTVYSINPADFELLPYAAWQLRDRRVWSFTSNQVSRVTVRHNGYARQLVRSANGEWSLSPGSQGVIKNTFALEETIYRLGELRAVVWVARGDENRARYGFTGDGLKLTIELKTADKPRSLSLEFGGKAPSQHLYALTTLDGQSWIFEFPVPLFLEVLRDLGNPPLRASAEL